MIIKNLLIVSIILMYPSAWAENQTIKSNTPVSFGLADKNGLLGLQFIPPDENDWVIKISGAEVSVKKNGTNAEVNSEIEGYIIKLDAPIEPISGYMEQLKQNIKQAFADHPKLKLEHFEVNPDPDKPLCVRVHTLLQGKKDTSWHSEQDTLSCGFKKYKGMGVELRYYNRYFDPNRDSQLAEKVNKIFNSVVIDN